MFVFETISAPKLPGIDICCWNGVTGIAVTFACGSRAVANISEDPVLAPGPDIASQSIRSRI